jgi:hypothetical protein
MLRWIVMLALSAGAAAQEAPVAEFGRGVLVSLNSGDRNQVEPSIAADGKGGVYVAWKDGQSGSSFLRFAYSHDYGDTWSQDVRLNDPDYKHQSDPVVMVGDDGRVTVSWVAYNTFSDTAIDMRVSTDRGKSFGPTMKQCLPTKQGAEDFFDRQWQMMDRDQVVTTYHVLNRIYAARSSDGGKTIEGVSQPDQARGGAVSAVITKTPNGVIHTVWLQFGRRQTLRYASSADDAKTWSEARDLVTLQRLDYRGRAQCFPTIDHDSAGNLFVAWTEGPGRDGEEDAAGGTYFIRSQDGGKTWSEPLKASDDEEATKHYKIQAWLCVDDRDRVHLAWLERRGGNWYVRYAASSDRGQTFSRSVAVSSPHTITGQYHSDFIGVAADDRYVYVAAPLPIGGVYETHVMRAPVAPLAFPAPVVRTSD